MHSLHWWPLWHRTLHPMWLFWPTFYWLQLRSSWKNCRCWLRNRKARRMYLKVSTQVISSCNPLSNATYYSANKPLHTADLSADNVRGWLIVRKGNTWSRRKLSYNWRKQLHFVGSIHANFAVNGLSFRPGLKQNLTNRHEKWAPEPPLLSEYKYWRSWVLLRWTCHVTSYHVTLEK